MKWLLRMGYVISGQTAHGVINWYEALLAPPKAATIHTLVVLLCKAVLASSDTVCSVCFRTQHLSHCLGKTCWLTPTFIVENQPKNLRVNPNVTDISLHIGQFISNPFKAYSFPTVCVSVYSMNHNTLVLLLPVTSLSCWVRYAPIETRWHFSLSLFEWPFVFFPLLIPPLSHSL